VKAPTTAASFTYNSTTTVRNAKAVTTVSSMWKAYLTALRLGYGWRCIW
jgi:hypothetical protein